MIVISPKLWKTLSTGDNSIKFLKLITGILIFSLTLNIAACGTILYPERKGQINGNLDITVMLLDGIGLLFFIIPGVIAFAVDFNNGTIYLPGSKKKSSGQKNADLNIIRIKKPIDIKHIEEIIQNNTGLNVNLNNKNIEIRKSENIEIIKKNVALL